MTNCSHCLMPHGAEKTCEEAIRARFGDPAFWPWDLPPVGKRVRNREFPNSDPMNNMEVVGREERKETDDICPCCQQKKGVRPNTMYGWWLCRWIGWKDLGEGHRMARYERCAEPLGAGDTPVVSVEFPSALEPVKGEA